MRRVSWIGPDENMNPVEYWATENEVIAIMRQVAEKRGKGPYLSDEEAFWDFVVVHWAEIHQ